MASEESVHSLEEVLEGGMASEESGHSTEEGLEGGQSGSHSTQGQQGENKWADIYKPVGTHIRQAVLYQVIYPSHFERKSGAHLLYLPLFGLVVVVALVHFLAIAAFVFSTKIAAEWRCHPIVVGIIYGAVHVQLYMIEQAYFGEKPGSDWLYLPMFGCVMVATVTFFLALVALLFETKIPEELRCRLVKLSLVGLMIGIALALTSFICSATAKGQPALA